MEHLRHLGQRGLGHSPSSPHWGPSSGHTGPYNFDLATQFLLSSLPSLFWVFIWTMNSSLDLPYDNVACVFVRFSCYFINLFIFFKIQLIFVGPIINGLKSISICLINPGLFFLYIDRFLHIYFAHIWQVYMGTVFTYKG